MAKTLAQLQKEISRLQKEADTLHQREVADVVARIQAAIAHYGLTPELLFAPAAAPRKRRSPGAKVGAGAADNAASGAAAVKTQRSAKAGKAAKKPPAPAKFHDGTGRTWSGHGKRPDWYKAAIASGKTPDELLIQR